MVYIFAEPLFGKSSSFTEDLSIIIATIRSFTFITIIIIKSIIGTHGRCSAGS